jgi:hypothetical protein
LLKDDDILTLKDILLEQEISHNSARNIRIENTLSQFDNKLIDVAKCFREEFNCSDIDKIYFVDTRNELNDASSLSVKEFQKMLKIALRRVEKLDVTKRNNLDIDFNMQSIMTFRKQCSEIKMRNTFYRLINGDFFTAV